eukprot:TRINITY_DN9326_c0_g1_i1.p1 TRINITY_DN9326_c0_g1~~TRINITY_DN9326_c0_g1_i1.p1  ORF type:complete len:352 (-),score=31.36 TRINITY_DN9326_c0_g1_i1:58-1113(-)
MPCGMYGNILLVLTLLISGLLIVFSLRSAVPLSLTRTSASHPAALQTAFASESAALQFEELSSARTKCVQVWQNARQGFGDVSERSSDLTMVHVGKTAGGSVRLLLQRFHIHGVQIIHMKPVPKEWIQNSKDVLVTMRDPLDRMLSAFYYGMPSAFNTKIDAWEQASTLEKKNGSWHIRWTNEREIERERERGRVNEYEAKNKIFRRHFHRCFKDVNSFAEQLDTASDCADYGRWMLESFRVRLSSHMGMGTCFYLGGLVDLLKTKTLHPFRIASVPEDFQNFMHALGYSVVDKANISKAMTSAGRHSSPHGNKSLSEVGRSKLKKFLAHEYWVQQELEAMIQKQRAREGQ